MKSRKKTLIELIYFCVLKVFLKKIKNFYFFKINIFLIFLNHFDMFILKIIFKK